jgi:hypothetical protein
MHVGSVGLMSISFSRYVFDNHERCFSHESHTNDILLILHDKGISHYFRYYYILTKTVNIYAFML